MKTAMPGGFGGQEHIMNFIEWLNPAYGTIKSEQYNGKGKLEQQTILQQIKE